MKPRSTAEHGTSAGYHRHVRDREKACEACRVAENEANRDRRAGRSVVVKRVCGCGKEVRSAQYATCWRCRHAGINEPLPELAVLHRRLCVDGCGQVPSGRHGGRCADCHDIHSTAVVGWMRLYPGGPLVGSHLPHNHATDCTAHVFCDNRREAA